MDKTVKKLILLSSIGDEEKFREVFIDEFLSKKHLYDQLIEQFKFKVETQQRIIINDLILMEISLVNRVRVSSDIQCLKRKKYFKLFFVYMREEKGKFATNLDIIPSNNLARYTLNIYTDFDANFQNALNNFIFNYPEIVSYLKYVDGNTNVRSVLTTDKKLREYRAEVTCA